MNARAGSGMIEKMSFSRDHISINLSELLVDLRRRFFMGLMDVHF